MRDFISYLESQSIRYQTRIKQGAFVPIKSLESSAFKTTAMYVSLALVITSIAILPFSYSMVSIKLPVNLLFIALGVFALGFWREYRELACDVRKIWFALVCLLVVVVMAYISLFWAVDSRATLQAIRQYLLEPSLFLVLAFFIATKLDERGLKLLLIGLCLALSYHPIATIWDFFANGGGKFGYRAMLPGYHTPQTVYVFYLLFPLGLALGFSMMVSGIKRAVAFGAVLVCCAALIANGGRFAILAGVAMLLVPFLICSYKYKRYILLGLSILVCSLGLLLYVMSKNWEARYNFYSMVQNFSTIWHTNPAQMGRFTYCDESFCSPHSLDERSNIQWEYSSLARLSMLKSTLLAIAQNPFRPNGYHFQQFPQNITKIFLPDSLYYPFTHRWHAHNHNYIISLWFELGFIGFGAVAAFMLYIFVRWYAKKLPLNGVHIAYKPRAILLCGVGIGLFGLIVSNLFDCLPVRDGQIVLFLLLGIMLATITPKDYNAIS